MFSEGFMRDFFNMGKSEGKSSDTGSYWVIESLLPPGVFRIVKDIKNPSQVRSLHFTTTLRTLEGPFDKIEDAEKRMEHWKKVYS